MVHVLSIYMVLGLQKADLTYLNKSRACASRTCTKTENKEGRGMV